MKKEKKYLLAINMITKKLSHLTDMEMEAEYSSETSVVT